MNIEIAIFNKIYGLIGNSICFDSLAIFFAKDFIWFLIILSFFAFLLFWRKQRLSKIFFLGSGTFILSYILLLLIQFIYFRPRPFVVLKIDPMIEISSLNPSFPSFHALVSFVFALIVYGFNKKIGSLFIFFAVLISLARILVGVHWFSDVLFGAIISILSFYLIRKFLKNINL